MIARLRENRVWNTALAISGWQRGDFRRAGPFSLTRPGTGGSTLQTFRNLRRSAPPATFYLQASDGGRKVLVHRGRVISPRPYLPPAIWTGIQAPKDKASTRTLPGAVPAWPGHERWLAKRMPGGSGDCGRPLPGNRLLQAPHTSVVIRRRRCAQIPQTPGRMHDRAPPAGNSERYAHARSLRTKSPAAIALGQGIDDPLPGPGGHRH